MNDYQARLQRLQILLSQVPCDAFFVEDEINLYYLTGLQLSAGRLLVHTRGAHLFVDGRYTEVCMKKSPFPVRPLENLSLKTLLESPEFDFIHILGFDSNGTTFKGYQEFVKATEELPPSRLKLIPVDSLVKKQRAIKDPQEIQLLREAADLGSEGFDFVCQILKEGISEEQVATELDIFWKRRGAKKVGFDPIIAFGTNSSMPHHRSGPSTLQRGDVVLIDIGVNYRHYHSDMTRMAFFGLPDPRLQEVHSIVAEAQQLALNLCAPGVTIGTIDRAARDFIAAKGFGAHFNHGLGHGVGLEIHELPVIKSTPPFYGIVLEAGMVITIEPGIYLSGIGGIRIEDTIVITDSGYENLTKRSVAPVMR